jgi:hypothetical protein
MDALELAIHCSSLIRPITRGDQRDVNASDLTASADFSFGQGHIAEASLLLEHRMDESECEKHFRLCGEYRSINYSVQSNSFFLFQSRY